MQSAPLDDGAIPVELAGFTAAMDDADVLLSWRTLSETNNAGFQVQTKSAGPCRWRDLDSAFVEGAGTTTEAQAYRYRVEDVGPGVHRFRLKQMDDDGSAPEFSREVEATMRAGEFALGDVYPNPLRAADSPATVHYEGAAPGGEVEAALYNSLGQRVRRFDVEAKAGDGRSGTLRIDLGGLSSGLYFVRVATGEHMATQSVTVVR
jgi:hypothetical protein